jgi:segregation and condensation protein A
LERAVRSARYRDAMSIATLELDLEVFSGPFDLLLTLVLREEVDLMELQITEVVLAYLDHLEARGELDLESATEFIVLMAALLELKSRLLIAGEDADELLDIEPEQAAEELLARMLQAHRYRGAAAHLRQLLDAESGFRWRCAPLPERLRRTMLDPGEGTESPQALGQALGGLLRMPPAISVRHISMPRVSVAERLSHLRKLLAAGRFSFEAAVAGADRVTVAVTLFALLELYKRGEASWEQSESFGEISVIACAPSERLGGDQVPARPQSAAA